MYDELVKRLREYEDSGLCEISPYEAGQAADAIEELMAYAQQLGKLRKEGWYLQKTEMMTYGQAIMTMPLPEPPKEG